MSDNDSREGIDARAWWERAIAMWLVAEARWERDQTEAQRKAALADRADALADRDQAIAERDEARAALDEARADRDDAITELERAVSALKDGALPASDAADPAHLRWAADLIEALPAGGYISQYEGWNPAELRSKADRLEAEASARSRRDTLTEKVARTLHRSGDFGQSRTWEELEPENREFFTTKAIAVVDVVLAEVAE